MKSSRDVFPASVLSLLASYEWSDLPTVASTEHSFIFFTHLKKKKKVISLRGTFLDCFCPPSCHSPPPPQADICLIQYHSAAFPGNSPLLLTTASSPGLLCLCRALDPKGSPAGHHNVCCSCSPECHEDFPSGPF